MLDENINCSPTQNERSIYISRMHRKNKRRRIIENNDHITESNDGSGTTKNTPALEYNKKWSDCTWKRELNKSSELDTTFIQSQHDIPYFDPFFDDSLLAMADHLDSYQKQHRNKRDLEHLLTDQGFINCTQLMEMEEKIRPPEIPTKGISNTTQFGVTETELFNCCAEAENQVRATSIEEPGTKATTQQKSIVEAILEDFDCSIEESFNEEASRYFLCKDQNSQNSPKSPPLQEHRTPKLRLENKPLRTYSRQNKVNTTRGNIAALFDDVPIAHERDDEEDNISCCSSHLSTTEDLSQLPNSPHHSDDHNEFINLSGNLLKLTTALSQKCVADVTVDFESNAEDNKALMEAAVNCVQNNSGIISSGKIDALDKKCNVGNQEAPTTSKFVTTISSKKIDICQKGKVKNSPEIYCSSDKSIDEEDLFKASEDEDEWNDDCNFFKNFRTQEVFWSGFNTNRGTCKRSGEYQGFMTASQKPIAISETAKQRAAHILAAVDAELKNEFQASQSLSVSNRLRKKEIKTNQLSVMPHHTSDHFRMPLNSAKISEEKNSSNIKELNQSNAHDLGNMHLSEWFIDATTEPVQENQNLGEENKQTSTSSIEQFSKMNERSLESANILKEEIQDNIQLSVSQKLIKISEPALGNAASISKALPDLEKEMPNELPPFGNEVEEKQNQCNLKRKFVADNTTEQSPKISCKSQSTETSSILRTPQTISNNNNKHSASALDSFSHIIAHKENFILSSCLNSVTPSRRNLLTLGKQKKVETTGTSKQMKLNDNENCATELTPLKSDVSFKSKPTPSTPDVAEFFLSIPNASTPQKCSPKESNYHSETSKRFGLELDKDFQNIDWETSSDTLTSNNADTSSISLNPTQVNETFNTSLKAKIERLSVYDNPPTLSPLVMSMRNNCRPSGLRRGRSLMKRT